MAMSVDVAVYCALNTGMITDIWHFYIYDICMQDAFSTREVDRGVSLGKGG
jgi:hypothetical protein